MLIKHKWAKLLFTYLKRYYIRSLKLSIESAYYYYNPTYPKFLYKTETYVIMTCYPYVYVNNSRGGHCPGGRSGAISHRSPRVGEFYWDSECL